MVKRLPLPCIACGFAPEPVTLLVDDQHQPYDAVMFSSQGNYGSTTFDPSNGDLIWINVCDKCLVAHKERVWFTRHLSQPPAVTISRPWDPQFEG